MKDNQLSDLFNGKNGKKLKLLDENKQKLKEVLKTIPKRETARFFDRLNFEHKLILNVVKMTAYYIEGLLAKIIRPFNNHSNGDERSIISTFIHSTGKLKVTNEALIITIEKQATPKDTKLLEILCDVVNEKEAYYPGTKLKLIFNTKK